MPFEEVLAELRAEWGLDARDLDRLLAALAPPGGTVGELVRASGVTRRDVEHVLDRLGAEPAGDRFALPAGDRFALPAARARPAVDEAALAATMTEIAAGLPPSRWDLDHVPATPATMAARAAYLTGEYDLAGRTLLCVGDHDLTSIAVTLAEPDAEALVVDVDQRLLAYIAGVARERDLPVTTVFGDLRLGLPASLEQRADLAFTDPPYTPEGVGLFVTRALAGLRRSGHERVALAYGFSPHQLTRGFRTQSVLHELRLVTEAMLPRFSRFDGAEAIGAAAALYVLHPTRWTWPVVERTGAGDARIYTRGAAAEEAAPAPPDPEVIAAVEAAVPGPDRVLAGDWPADMAGTRVPLDLAARGEAVAVNLAPHHGATLPAALLAATARTTTAIVAPGRDIAASAPARRLVAPVLDVTVSAGVLVARRKEPDDGVLAWLVTHPSAALGNAWREALLREARRHGAELTKNEARAIVRGAGLPPGALGLRLAELPRDSVERLLAAVPETARLVRP
jgi:N4-bis(aminopropyl)spermidine synthase